MRMILFSILPHGVVEVPTLVYSACLGMYLMQTIKLWHKSDEREKKQRQALVLKSYAYFIVPLILFAAGIETFITPAILSILK